MVWVLVAPSQADVQSQYQYHLHIVTLAYELLTSSTLTCPKCSLASIILLTAYLMKRLSTKHKQLKIQISQFFSQLPAHNENKEKPDAVFKYVSESAKVKCPLRKVTICCIIN